MKDLFLLVLTFLSFSAFTKVEVPTLFKVVEAETSGAGCVNVFNKTVKLHELWLNVGEELEFPLSTFDRGLDQHWCIGETEHLPNGFRFEVRGMCDKYDITFTEQNSTQYNLDINILKYQNTCKYRLKLIKQ